MSRSRWNSAGPVALAVLLAAGVACSRRSAGPKAPEPLRGNAVWFAEGVSGDDAALEESLLGFRCAAVFLPARRIEASGATGTAWTGSDLPAPPQPFARIPVVLVVESETDPLAGRSEKEQKKFGAFLAREIAAARSRGSAFGTIRGVHLDFPFSAETAAAHAAALREARSLRPRGSPETHLTWSLRRPLPADEKQRKAIRELVSRTDGLVAFVFGDGDAADPAMTDSLGKLWWAGYSAVGSGVVRTAAGEVKGHVDEGAVDPLSNDPRMELILEVPWNSGRGSEFALRARRALQAPGASVAAGDSVVFALPSLADLVARLPEDRARRRFYRGTVVVLRGHSDARRLFPTVALGDVLAGRPTVPALRLWTEPTGGLLRLQAENTAPHESVVSRIQNWVEVDLAPARVGDVETGGFERWEAYDSTGRSVSPGRATRVRFFETFVAPLERFEPARLRVRGKLPSPCCRMRMHLAPATGGELATDWALPEESPKSEVLSPK